MIHGALTLHTAHANRSASIRRVWTLTFRPWGRLGGVAPARLFHVARVDCNRNCNRPTLLRCDS